MGKIDTEFLDDFDSKALKTGGQADGKVEDEDSGALVLAAGITVIAATAVGIYTYLKYKN